MDKTVPPGAARLLDFISSIEAPAGYDTLYGNAQKRYDWRLTDLTIAQVLTRGAGWASAHGSSACGAYQFMAGRNHTLAGLVKELGLGPNQVFDADLQDRLAYHLLIRRGYGEFVAGKIGPVEFGKRLAQEWASFPVLAATKGAKRFLLRGQSYYAGDGLNKSLVKPERVEAVLAAVLALDKGRAPGSVLQGKAKDAQTKAAGQAGGAIAVGGGAAASAPVVDVASFDWTAWLLAGGLGLAAAALIAFLIWRAVINTRRGRAYRDEAGRG